jgi:HAMP domain-containing protein
MPLLGGVRPPIAALLCLLLAVAAVTALVLGRTAAQDVAPAVLTSQQHIAEDSAASLRISVDADVSALRDAAAALQGKAAQDGTATLRTVSATGHSWRGLALIDPDTKALRAVSGESVPLSAVSGVQPGDRVNPKLVTLPSGGSRLLTFATVDLVGAPQQLLVASDTLALPALAGATGRTLALVDSGGKALLGAVSATAGTTRATAADRTAGAVNSGLAVSSAHAARSAQHRTSAAGTGTAVSGSLSGSAEKGNRTIAGWSVLATADISPAAHALGLTVVTTVSTPQTHNVTGDTLLALVAGGSLLAAALLVTLLLTLGLQRPLLRLHLGATRLARGDLSRPMPVPRLGEAARIGSALEALRLRLLGEAEAAPGRRLGSRFGSQALVLCCALVLVGWSVPFLLLIEQPAPSNAVPQQLITDQQTRTGLMADQIQRTLSSGYLDLGDAASALTATSTPAQAQSLLEATAKSHKRYRSLSVITATGEVLAHVGEAAQRPDAPVPAGSGLVQVNTTGRVPIIAAYTAVPTPVARVAVGSTATAKAAAPTANSPVAVVGEFDVKTLDTALDHTGIGQAWLVDAQQQVVGSRDGFRAFQSLPAASLTDLAARASATASATKKGAAIDTATAPVVQLDGSTIEAATTTGAVRGANAHGLDWQVVTSQPTSWLDLGQYRTQRLTVLVGLLGLAAAVGCLGWLFIVVVRPLRALTAIAENLAAGDVRTVLYPVHHDEVGSVTRSLELVRQQLLASGDRPPARAEAPSPRPTPRV